MSTIPQVRVNLTEIGDGLARRGLHTEARQIYAQVNQLWRRKAVRRAPATRPGYEKLSAEKIEAIRAFMRDNPNMAYQDAAQMFNVNPGRISEIMAGFRR